MTESGVCNKDDNGVIGEEMEVMKFSPVGVGDDNKFIVKQ